VLGESLFKRTAWIACPKDLKLECGPMPNVMAAVPNVGGALCESSIIPFLVPCRKVWLTPAAVVPCSNAAYIGECKTWTQSEFYTWWNSVVGKSPQKCIYSVAAQETSKHCEKFGWPPVSDVAAVTKPRRETHWNLLGCPKLPNRSQLLVGWSLPYCGSILLFHKFFSWLLICALVAKI